MKTFYRVLISIYLVFCYATVAYCDSLVLSDELEFLREIDKAYLIAELDFKDIEITQADFRLIQPASNSANRWILAGAIEKNSSALAISYAFVVIGKNGQLTSTSRKQIDLSRPFFNSRPTDDLKNVLQQQQQVLKSFEVQKSAQAENVERLQNDADNLANVGRIVELEDNVSRVQADTARFMRIKELLIRDIENMRVAESPRNFQKRLSDLSTQLSEITAAGKTAQAGEPGRRANAQTELEEKLALIETTRNEHIDLLQNDLAKVRRERELLEKSIKVGH